MANNNLDATIKKLDKSIAKPVYSARMDGKVKIRSADPKVLNELAKSIRAIIKNSEDAKPQHST